MLQTGVPDAAEIIPFEPEPGNAGGGMGGSEFDSSHILKRFKKGVAFFVISTSLAINCFQIRESAMFSRIIIISGGRLGDAIFFQKRAAALAGFMTICCDGGSKYLDKLKIKPDVIIGDMDSVKSLQLERYAAGGAKILRYPPDKDATDTQLAVEYALGLKPKTVEIWGAWGGRIDHALANLFLLDLGRKAAIKISLIDEYCETFIANGEISFPDAVGQTVSLFAFHYGATKIILDGFRYSLNGESLKMGNSRGVSNVITASPATIRVCSGNLLVVRYWRKDFFPKAV